MTNTDSAKLMNLADKLALALGTGPEWKNGYVIYCDEFDEFYTQMSLDLTDGCWQIHTGECGMIYLPKEAPELMTEMSELINKKE